MLTYLDKMVYCYRFKIIVTISLTGYLAVFCILRKASGYLPSEGYGCFEALVRNAYKIVKNLNFLFYVFN